MEMSFFHRSLHLHHRKFDLEIAKLKTFQQIWAALEKK